MLVVHRLDEGFELFVDLLAFEFQRRCNLATFLGKRFCHELEFFDGLIIGQFLGLRFNTLLEKFNDMGMSDQFIIVLELYFLFVSPGFQTFKCRYN